MKIAWIGCGVMGTSMLLNLKKGGHTVSAYNLSLIHISRKWIAKSRSLLYTFPRANPDTHTYTINI